MRTLLLDEFCPKAGLLHSEHAVKCLKLDNELSRGEICAGNFIPPANGESLGSYLVKN